MAINAELIHSNETILPINSQKKSVLVISICRKDNGWVLTVCTQRILFDEQLENFQIIILQFATAYLWE